MYVVDEKLPGEISRSRSRSFGVDVVLVDTTINEVACLRVRYELEESGRYAVVCLDHFCAQKFTSKSIAESVMSDPASFCSTCMNGGPQVRGARSSGASVSKTVRRVSSSGSRRVPVLIGARAAAG